MPKRRLTLVVALDEALIRTPIAHEAFWSAFARDAGLPLRLGGVLMLGGLARARAEITARGALDPATLPYVPETLATIRRWRRQRGQIVLLAAEDAAPLAQAVADHLGLFDAVLGLPPDPQARAAALSDRFGAQGFAYLGASPRDLPIWNVAGSAVSVAAAAGLRARLDARDTPADHLRERRNAPADWAHALAAPDWGWNLAVFLALLGLEPGTDIAPMLAPLALIWLAFGLTGSGAALMRDLLRLARLRATQTPGPLAKGRVSFRTATPLALILPVAGLAVAFPAGLMVLACLVLASVGPIIAEQHALGRLGRGWLFRIGLIALRPFAGLLALGVPLGL